MAKFIEINPDNPPARKIAEVVSVLKNGGIIIYPTDTVYAMGCDIHHKKAIEKLSLIKKIKPEKANFSFICKDISEVAQFCKHLPNATFKTLKNNLPGPYTFILEANNTLPKLLQTKKKTVGIRIPDHNIPIAIVEALGSPIITTSIKQDDDIIEYPSDPWEIAEQYDKLVDIVIDGGFGGITASTVIDFTKEEPTLIREGLGDPEI